MNYTMKTLTEAIEELEAAGWRYLPDATTWTGGFWWHDETGGATNQGGPWATISEATESVMRLIVALQMCERGSIYENPN